MRFKLVFACGFLQRLCGLLFRPHNWLMPGEALAFAGCSCVHTFFMKHPMDVAFLDSCGRVLMVKTQVPPFRIVRCGGSYLVLERFASKQPWIEAGSTVGACVDETL